MRRISPEALAEELENREIPGWNWTKNGGAYHQKHDFFTVHWEVKVDDRNSVRLHVESPIQSIDPFLNDVKQEVISAILASSIADEVRHKGFVYMPGSRISASSVQNNRSTEPFRVILTQSQRKPSIQDDITTVHDAIGPYVDEIVQKFAERLNQHFIPEQSQRSINDRVWPEQKKSPANNRKASGCALALLLCWLLLCLGLVSVRGRQKGRPRFLPKQARMQFRQISCMREVAGAIR